MKSIRKHFLFIIFYFALIFIGIRIYNDYGISWDEVQCRIDNGVLNTNFIKTGDPTNLLHSISKYHGPAFEMLLVEIEYAMKLDNMHDIFVMRHLVTFILFALSVFFFYLLCLKSFKSKWLSLFGCVFLVLSPRIFADAFYNSKDMAFLSLVIISVYATLIFIERKTIASALLCALICGITIDVRMLGMVIPFYILLSFTIDFFRVPTIRKKIILTTVIFVVMLVGSIILFWPVLWLGPIEHFLGALREMSKYPWGGNVLYNGEIVPSSKLPWHYLPVWIIISTPVIYLILFLSGIVMLTMRLIRGNKILQFESLNLFVFFVPLLSIILMNSVVYDGWRHVYFIYPSFIIISLIGLNKFIQLCDLKKMSPNILKSILALYCLYNGILMARMHPFENVYFNFIGGKSLAEARNKFEADYWALSYKQGFEYILKNDTSSMILVSADELDPAMDNRNCLPPAEQSRIIITDANDMADFHMKAYREYHNLDSNKNRYDIIRDNGVIHSVYDLRRTKASLTDKNLLLRYFNNYESNQPDFYGTNTVMDSSSPGDNHIDYVLADMKYSGNLSFVAPKELTDESPLKKYIRISFDIRVMKQFDGHIVIQLDSGITQYQWKAFNAHFSVNSNWQTQNFLLDLPEIYSAKDNIKVYIENGVHSPFYLDNLDIRFYGVSIKDLQIAANALPPYR